jgi:hypothetical protein
VERNHLENLDVGGRVILDLQKVGWGGMDWIALSKDRDRSRPFVNAVMYLWIS